MMHFEGLATCSRAELSTPIGHLLLWHQDSNLVLASWRGHEDRSKGEFERQALHGVVLLRQSASAIPVPDAFDAYFSGQTGLLDELGLIVGGTPFQRSVWSGLLSVPAGRTATYSQLARQIGRPRASRAVGQANGANPLPIAIGCHRILGSNGTLTGYGSGTARKAWLIDHERSHCSN
jgi:methylated-DNA-[protein]-cysteine S-methyltransferase